MLVLDTASHIPGLDLASMNSPVIQRCPYVLLLVPVNPSPVLQRNACSRRPRVEKGP
jgi:hypothetical protein